MLRSYRVTSIIYHSHYISSDCAGAWDAQKVGGVHDVEDARQFHNAFVRSIVRWSDHCRLVQIGRQPHYWGVRAY